MLEIFGKEFRLDTLIYLVILFTSIGTICLNVRKFLTQKIFDAFFIMVLLLILFISTLRVGKKLILKGVNDMLPTGWQITPELLAVTITISF